MTAATSGTHEKLRMLFFVLTVLCAVTMTPWFAHGAATIWLALLAIAVGIWHGAFDGILAEAALQPLLGRRWTLVFYSVYLFLAALVLALWWAKPVWALTAFLLYSGLHFGMEGETNLSPGRLLAGVCQGAVPIAAACSWQPQAVAAIFRPMLETGRGADMAGVALQLTHAAGVTLWPAATVCLLSASLRRRHEGAVPFVLLFAELALFRICSPVAAFAVFFCTWHTPEHLVSSSLDASGSFQPLIMVRHLRQGMAPWSLSLVAVAVACWMGRHSASADAGIVFIALSALTVPHMVLTELCRRRQARPQVFVSNKVSIEAVLPS